MIWSFGGFELDEERFELRRGGAVVELRRKVFDVLRYLVAQNGRLVSKDELLQSVWPRETIQEGVVAQNIAILRRALGDSRDEAKLIQTVHGRGYRFIADVSAARVERARSVPPAQPPVTAPDAHEAFVGREHVMHELRKLLRTSLAGKGAFAVISGDAGIGKTRTAGELAAEALALGARVLEGRCHEADGAPAFWPWVQLLRAAAREPDGLRAGEPHERGARDPELETLLDALRGASALPRSSEVDPPRALLTASPQLRFRLFDAITQQLARLARAQPLVLIFDDLHWADEATLHLLRFVARELRTLPLLVLGTSREIGAAQPIAAGGSSAEPGTSALLCSLLGGNDVHRIYLDGLSHAATCALAAATLARDLGELTLRDLHALTEGNPFFVHEVLRLLADDSGEQPGEQRWRAELPRRLREVIGLRLSRLPPPAQRLLALASVIGREFGVAVLEQVAGLPRAELLRLLEAATDARLLRETAVSSDGALGHGEAPAGRYAFAHALIRESLYAELSEPERVRVHEQVGHALEALFGVDADAHLDELAHHFHRAASAGDVPRAVMYCSRAAEQAMHLLAFEQAVLNYRRALDALACRLPIDELQRFELKLALGSAQFRAGEDGNPALLGAAEIARRLQRPELLAQVVLAMAGWPRLRARGRTNNHALYPLLAEAIGSTREDTSALRVRLLSALALNLPEETPLAVQLTHAREALELARGLAVGRHEDVALYDALLARLFLMQAPEDTARRLALAGELLEVARRIGDKEHVFTAHEQRVQPLIALGDVSTSDREIAACAQLADELRLPRCHLQVLRFQMQRALGDGRFDEIRPLTEEAVRVRGRAELSPGYLATLFAWTSYERTFRGKRTWFERNIQHMTDRRHMTELMRSHLAYVYAQFGELAHARSWYAPMFEPGVLDAARADNRPFMYVLLADAVHACGDRVAAAELYPRLLPSAALNAAHFELWVYLGSCAHWLGLLAALLGEPKLAATHFETALEFNASMGARPALARTSLAYARTLLHSGNALPRSVAAHARSLLREATTLAEQLEMRGVLREAQQLAD